MSTFLNQIAPGHVPRRGDGDEMQADGEEFCVSASCRAAGRILVRWSSQLHGHVLEASVSAASAFRGSMVVSIIAMMPSPMSVFSWFFIPLRGCCFYMFFCDILIFRVVLSTGGIKGIVRRGFFLSFFGWVER